jgi:hypothetical protein
MRFYEPKKNEKNKFVGELNWIEIDDEWSVTIGKSDESEWETTDQIESLTSPDMGSDVMFWNLKVQKHRMHELPGMIWDGTIVMPNQITSHDEQVRSYHISHITYHMSGLTGLLPIHLNFRELREELFECDEMNELTYFKPEPRASPISQPARWRWSTNLRSLVWLRSLRLGTPLVLRLVSKWHSAQERLRIWRGSR